MSPERIGTTVLKAVAALVLLATGAHAQIPLTPRALGMGGALVASARGFESILYNPANLGLSDTPAWSIAFPQITVGASVLGPDVADLPDFVNFDDLSPERRQELLARIPENGTSVDLVTRAPVAQLQIGRFGVGLSYAVLGEHTVGKDLIELLFEGYEEGRTDYRVGNTVGTRASYWDLAAGYGMNLGSFSVGLTGHYYRAGSLVRTRAFEPEYGVLDQSISVDYVGVYSRGGSGWGLDLGAAYEAAPGLVFSAAVANVVGSLDWDEQLEGRILTLTEADFDDAEPLILEERWEASTQDLGENPSGRFAQVAADLEPESWAIPRTVRLGAAWRPAGGTEIGAAYHTSMADDGEGLLGGKWENLLGVGIQQQVPFVTLRLGASSNLAEGHMIGGGVRLGVIDLGIARFKTAGVLTDADRDGWAASFSVNVRTQATVGNPYGGY